MANLGATIDELFEIIAQRKVADPTVSYTAKMIQGDLDSLLKKIGEEATEVVMATKDNDSGHLCYEAVDLLYHLFLVCERMDVSADELAAEIRKRFK